MVYVSNNLLFSHLNILIKEYTQMVLVKRETNKSVTLLSEW